MELSFRTWFLAESSVTEYLRNPDIRNLQNTKILVSEIQQLVNQNFQLRQDMKESLSKLFIFWKMKKDPEMFTTTSVPLTNLQILELKREVRESIEFLRDFIVHESSTNWSEFKKKLNSLEYKPEDMSRENEQYHERLKTAKRPKPAEGEIVPLGGMPSGWTWVSLSKGYCKQEGDAMGHCGNVGRRAGDNIFSLRGPDGGAYLTFIVNNGALGESKGRENQKPSAKYHPQIMALLLGTWKGKPIIESIEGGGYAPENNFKVSDLSPENLELLSQEKLFLVDPLGYILNVYKISRDEGQKRLKQFFHNAPLDFAIDFKNQEIILNAEGDKFYDFNDFLSKNFRSIETPDLDELLEKVNSIDFYFDDRDILSFFKNYANKKNRYLLVQIAEKVSQEDFEDELEVAESDPEIMSLLREAVYDGHLMGIESRIIEDYKNHLLGYHDFADLGSYADGTYYGFHIYEKDNKFYLALVIDALKEFEKIEGFAENDLGDLLRIEEFKPDFDNELDPNSYNESLEEKLELFLKSST
jgi:hypothetical protein